MSVVRLDKYLANAGCGTRTEVKELLKKGLVAVNDTVIRRPETKIDEETDRIVCRGTEISREGFRYYMLNKPAGYLSATEDRHQPVVLQLLTGEEKKNLFPVGRLDIDTEGLLLITDDGALAHELLSPGKHVDKTYRAVVEGIVTEEDCRRFGEGVDIGEKRKTLPAKLVLLPDGQGETMELAGAEKEGRSAVEITIREGKFHQIKRMFAAVGKRVVYLKRISMGSLRLDPELKPGDYRRLTEEEIAGLKNRVEETC